MAVVGFLNSRLPAIIVAESPVFGEEASIDPSYCYLMRSPMDAESSSSSTATSPQVEKRSLLELEFEPEEEDDHDHHFYHHEELWNKEEEDVSKHKCPRPWLTYTGRRKLITTSMLAAAGVVVVLCIGRGGKGTNNTQRQILSMGIYAELYYCDFECTVVRRHTTGCFPAWMNKIPVKPHTAALL